MFSDNYINFIPSPLIMSAVTFFRNDPKSKYLPLGLLYLDTSLQTPKNGKNKTQKAACVVYRIRSWKKLSPFEEFESKSLFDIIKSTQRIKLAPNIKSAAEVNGDMLLPNKNV